MRAWTAWTKPSNAPAMPRPIDGPRCSWPASRDPSCVQRAGRASPLRHHLRPCGRACRAGWASSGCPTRARRAISPGTSAPAEVSRLLGRALDAFTIHQVYSRLVDRRQPRSLGGELDRDAERADPVPGNRDLIRRNAKPRAREIFWPYHDRIAAELDRAPGGRPGRGRDRRCTASPRSSRAWRGPGMPACSTTAIRASP